MMGMGKILIYCLPLLPNRVQCRQSWTHGHLPMSLLFDQYRKTHRLMIIKFLIRLLFAALSRRLLGWYTVPHLGLFPCLLRLSQWLRLRLCRCFLIGRFLRLLLRLLCLRHFQFRRLRFGHRLCLRLFRLPLHISLTLL